METLCPSVQSSGEAARDELTVAGILRAFLPLLLHLLKLSGHKLRVLWQLAACGTPALGANLFHWPHCEHRHWAPRSCGNRHCPRCLAAKSWQWLDKQTRSLLPITYYHCVFTLPAELNQVASATPSNSTARKQFERSGHRSCVKPPFQIIHPQKDDSQIDRSMHDIAWLDILVNEPRGEKLRAIHELSDQQRVRDSNPSP